MAIDDRQNWEYLDVVKILGDVDDRFCLLLADGEVRQVAKANVLDADDYGVGDSRCTLLVRKCSSV